MKVRTRSLWITAPLVMGVIALGAARVDASDRVTISESALRESELMKSAAALEEAMIPGNLDSMSHKEALAYLEKSAPLFKSFQEPGVLESLVPKEYMEPARRVVEQMSSEKGRAEFLAESTEAENNPETRKAVEADAADPKEVRGAPTEGATYSTPPTPRDSGVKVEVANIPGVGTPPSLLCRQLKEQLAAQTEAAKSSTNLTESRDGKTPIREFPTTDPEVLGGPEGPEGCPPPNPPPAGCPAIGTGNTPGGGVRITTPKHDSFLSAGAPWSTLGGTAEVVNGFLKVVVHVKDANKGFSMDALDVWVHRKSTIGNHASTIFQARVPAAGAPAGGGLFCYANTAGSGSEGYAVVWVPLNGASIQEPGFQIYAEVVEWDPYFQFGQPGWDIALAQAGPQFWTGADQVMLHVGQAPMTTRSSLAHAAGVFLAASLLVDLDSNPGNDAENKLRGLVLNGIQTGLNNVPSYDFIGQFFYDALTPKKFTNWQWDGEGQASFEWDSNNAPNALDWAGLFFGGILAQVLDLLLSFKVTSLSGGSRTVDLTWNGVTGQSGDFGVGVDASISGLELEGKMRFFTLFWCKGGFDVSATGNFDAWVEEGATSPLSLRTHASGKLSNVKATNLWMPWYNWARPGCVAGWLLAKWVGKGIAAKALTKTVLNLLNGKDGAPGKLEEILNGLNIAGSIPTIGGIQPSLTGFADSCASLCSTDESFGTTPGLDVLATGNLGTIGAAFGGTWPNVVDPTTTATVRSVVAPHTDSGGTVRDIGAVIDARLISVLFHDLTEKGLLNFGSGGAGATSTIAPIYNTKASGLLPVAVPDLKVELGGHKFRISLVGTVNATWDQANGAVVPTVTLAPEVEFTSCLADYNSAYFFSYGYCGHANQSNAGLPTITQVVSDLANQLGQVLGNTSLGQLKLPSLSGFIPGVSLGLTNVAIQNRGGQLGIYGTRLITPLPTISVTSVNPDFTFSATVANLPGTGPITWLWKLYDPFGGLVKTCTTQSCYEHYLEFKGELIQPGKWICEAEAQVTASRGGASVSGSAYDSRICQ